MKKAVNILARIFILLFLVALGCGGYFLHTRISRIEDSLQNESQETMSERFVSLDSENDLVSENEAGEVQIANTCGTECKNEIAKLVAEAVEALPQSTTTTVVQAPASTSTQIAYIPLGTTATTTNTDWVDVSDSAIYVDLINDYGSGAKVSWEASLKVAHGNGKAFVRLHDATNKIAVDYSEITTTDNVNFEQVSSVNLPFWRGRNLYKIQIKSLNSFEVTCSGGKLKVVY
ncbi:hypothetical protein KKB40_01350 [Patescibacteria group bacterium]|nr:hypothetical protein [Patescibacteria group bacterium]